MTSLLSVLTIYLLGGLTFLPLLLASAFLYAYLTFPEVPPSALDPDQLRRPEDADDTNTWKTADEKLVRRLANSVDVAAGYFLVTREFVPGGVNGKPPERASPVGTSAPQTADSPSVYQSMYRSLFERKSTIGAVDSAAVAKARAKRARNEFFVVLRHGHLMLYDDEDQTEVRHVISLSLYLVDIYGGGEVIPEGELYIRRNAIRLVRRTDSPDPAIDRNVANMPFYMFSENCSQKEDFYLALVKDQERTKEDPSVPPKPMLYKREDIVSLVQRLHSSEDHLQMNWVNGLLGRVFLSVYRTPEVEEFFRMKFTKKISRVNKPNFLSDIKLRQITVGNSVPYITNPRLKEMTTDGDFCAEADVTYSGNFRLEVSAKATLNLGARFKPREVTLVLACVLKRLEGHALIRIKPPPSNRLWFSFERMPKMDLSIEPIVGSRQVAWGPILRIIEGRIREVVAETVVLPYYDDIPFTDTIDQRFRGGIWQTRPGSKPTRTEADVPKEREQADDDTLGEGDDGDIPEPVDAIPELHFDPGQHQLEDPPASSPSTSPFQLDITKPPTQDDAESSKTTSSAQSTRSLETKPRGTKTHTPVVVSAPSPSTDTNTINITALKPHETLDATSAFASLRSRSTSSPVSPTPPPPAVASYPPRAETLRTASTSSRPPPPSFTDDPPPRFLASGSATSFGSSTSQSGFGNDLPPAHEKTSLAALSTATATLKKWYASRAGNNNNNNNPTTSSSSSSSSEHRNLPPTDIPPPVPSRKQSTASASIQVPKTRRHLPPPPLPKRGRKPALPPRNAGMEERVGEMLVVAAPRSEPETPVEEERREDDDDDDGVEEFECDGASVGSRRSAREREREGEGWERERVKERALEESEMWHPAEEAEMRGRVPWDQHEA